MGVQDQARSPQNEILIRGSCAISTWAHEVPGKHKKLWDQEPGQGHHIDQSDWKNPAFNPATYTGVFDMICDLFAGTTYVKVRVIKGKIFI